MTTAILPTRKLRRGSGWLAQLPVPAGVRVPDLPVVAAGHPTQATVRWS